MVTVRAAKNKWTVGNACRTKNQIRNSKSRGSTFEYDCQESLLPVYPDVYLTKQRGFQLQYDLQSDEKETVFECKRLKGISWNQLVKLYKKLRSVKPDCYYCYILFQSNFQPCLVFNGTTIKTFEKEFDTPFVKHTPVRRGKDVNKIKESKKDNQKDREQQGNDEEVSGSYKDNKGMDKERQEGVRESNV